MKNNKREQGFSLIELLIVVAIMLVIAAIAIPAVANAMRAGRESAAASSLRTLNTAETSYSQAFKGFAAQGAAANMGGASATCASGAVTPTAACEIENQFSLDVDGGGAVKGNYKYTRLNATPTTFTWIATPNGGILDGRRDFCVVQGGSIHATPVGTVGAITDTTTCLAQPTL